MFFAQEDCQFQLLDVLYFNEFNVVCRTFPRSHCALSLRLNADTEIEFPDGIVHMHTGDLAIFPPDATYFRRTRQDEMIVFHFNLIQGTPPSRLEVLHDCDMAVLCPLFEKALAQWQDKRPGYQYRVAGYFYEIFAELQNPKQQRENLNPTLRQAIGWMQAHYQDSEATIELAAEELNISGTYLRRIFHNALGKSPKQYLNELRMEQAKRLLNAGYDSVEAVAEKAGFRDGKNFATAFKKKFGYPPSRQRYGI